MEKQNSIINEFIGQNDIERVQETLSDLFKEWVCSEANHSEERRKQVVYDYDSLENLLRKIKKHQTD